MNHDVLFYGLKEAARLIELTCRDAINAQDAYEQAEAQIQSFYAGKKFRKIFISTEAVIQIIANKNSVSPSEARASWESRQEAERKSLKYNIAKNIDIFRRYLPHSSIPNEKFLSLSIMGNLLNVQFSDGAALHSDILKVPEEMLQKLCINGKKKLDSNQLTTEEISQREHREIIINDIGSWTTWPENYIRKSVGAIDEGCVYALINKSDEFKSALCREEKNWGSKFNTISEIDVRHIIENAIAQIEDNNT